LHSLYFPLLRADLLSKLEQNIIKMQKVLALETSCDETAASVLLKKEGKISVLSNIVASQIPDHAIWGGVVPEIAARKHLETLPFVFQKALTESGEGFNTIDAIAATVSPGLIGSLNVGSITARTLSAIHNLPFIGVHHLEGHLSSVLLAQDPPIPPYMVLLVSGGHTELIHVSESKAMKRLGRSHDDAAGEAFDKVGRLLGLDYPGGPEIEKIGSIGDPYRFKLPKGRVSNPEGGYYPYDFSFSGLKTAVLRLVEKLNHDNIKLPSSDIAASFENVVAEVLVERSIRCTLDNNLDKIILVGGVAANKRLRKMILEKAGEKSINVYLAPLPFCTDNAAMIGAAALSRLDDAYLKSSLSLGVSARWPIEGVDSFYDDIPPF
tara:strand:- start:163 stop:1302 length:1140 start_codon:yes stop_codon:yes gene_type:complete